MRHLLGLALVVVAFSVSNCHKKAKSVADNPVPSTPVNLRLYPNDPLNYKVQFVGGWLYLDGGINGIILYRKSDQEFVAIERTSSQLPSNAGARVKVMSDNFTLVDTVSASRWRMFDGTVTKGPAQWSLRLYGTNYDGTTLTIRN